MYGRTRRHSCVFAHCCLLAALVIVALSKPTPASAQVLYGSIVGEVTDPNGAVVPGAAVTATNQETGVAQTARTDAGGTYQFVNLQPGTYTVKVVASGFKSYERRDLPVEAN